MDGTLNIVLFLRKGRILTSSGHDPQRLGEVFCPYLKIFLGLIKQWISIGTPCLSHRLCVYPSPQAHSFSLGTICCNMGKSQFEVAFQFLIQTTTVS